VGDCAGGEGDAQTGFTTGWDPDLAVELGTIWVERRLISGSLIEVEHLIDVEDLVRIVDAIVRGGASMSLHSVTVAPRPPAQV